MKQSISVVVPVYNEEEIISETIDIFSNILQKLGFDYEIVVVDDGSTDQTYKILLQLQQENKKLIVYQNMKNMGSGASLWLGFCKATKEFVISNFADRPFDLYDLEQIFPVFVNDSIDFIVVTRTNRKANTFFRKCTSYVNYWVIRLLFHLKIDDFQFVQIYKRDILKGVSIQSTETFVPPELMMKLIAQGKRYVQVQTTFHKRTGGVAKCGRWGKIIKCIHEISCFWFTFNFSRAGGKRSF